MIRLDGKEWAAVIGVHVLIAAMLFLCGCSTVKELEYDIKALGEEFAAFLKEWESLSLDDVWDKLRGKEAKKDDTGWMRGAQKIDVPERPVNWSWEFTTQGIDPKRGRNEAAERALFCVFLTNGKIYPYTMPGGRNSHRARGKGGDAFNMSCGDAIWTPIFTEETVWHVSVSNGVFDITANGQPLGRKDRSRGIRGNYLPIKVGDARLKAFVVSQWPNRMLKSPWKAGEVKIGGAE